MNHLRNGKSIPEFGRIPPPHPGPRRDSSHRLSWTCADFDPNSSILFTKPILVTTIAHVDANSRAVSHNRCVCHRLVCSGTKKELNESTPWYRTGHICLGHIADIAGLVSSQTTKNGKEAVSLPQINGMKNIT